jgi:hypothetical protein
MSLSPPDVQPLPDLDAVGDELKDLEQKARTMIMQRPMLAMLVAAGVGYVVARIASRAKR